MNTQLSTSILLNHHVSFAHRLVNDAGLCKNIHGHTWHITVKIQGEIDPMNGMITNFGPLKQVIKAFLDGEYDHATVLQKEDPFVKIFQEHDQRLVILENPPTTEILAGKMYAEIQTLLDEKFPGLHLLMLELQETPSNKVVVER